MRTPGRRRAAAMFGTRSAAAGVSVRTPMGWMGHRDLHATLNYADFAPNAEDTLLVASASPEIAT